MPRWDRSSPTITSSFTAFALAPGVLNTTTPRSDSSATGMLLTPAPARPTANQEKSALNAQVEAAKKQFKGSELNGRTLGIVGLGAIGSMVADMALGLGMRVLGYDPALSVEAAWRLSSQVQRMENMAALLAKSDLVSLHVPALPETQGLFN